MIRETEENPFSGDEDEKPAPPRSRPTSFARPDSTSSKQAHVHALMGGSALADKKPKKEKDRKEKDRKGSRKKSRPFNLEAEKDKMKTCIAESNIAATNLLNALRLINREQEQISENKNVVAHFENCKLLRRKILRYVRYPLHLQLSSLTISRSSMSNPRIGLVPSCTLTTSSLQH